MKNKRYIGIDLHHNNFTCCIIQKDCDDFFKKFPLTEEGFEEFFRFIKKSDILALESSGNSTYFYNSVISKVRDIKLVCPYKFKLISKSHKKTDNNDAKNLAYGLSKDILPLSRIKSQTASELISLILMRKHFVQINVNLRNKAYAVLIHNGILPGDVSLLNLKKLNAYSKEYGLSSNRKNELKLLGQQINNIHISILQTDKMIKEIAGKMYGYENLLSIKGIGYLSAAIFLAVIDDIDDFPSAAKLASYFGIVPSIRSSNQKNYSGGITKQGTKLGRTALAQCTLIAIRYNPYLKKFYDRIKERGGGKKALIACSRKMLVIIYDTLKNDRIFENFVEYKYYDRKSS